MDPVLVTVLLPRRNIGAKATYKERYVVGRLLTLSEGLVRDYHCGEFGGKQAHRALEQ